MKKLYLNINLNDARSRLMPLLEGHVFHVAKEEFGRQIELCDEIKANVKGDLDSSFGSSSNSYFRNMGCVSLFDFREIQKEEVNKHVYKCAPWAPLDGNNSILIYIFSSAIYSDLIPWSGWKKTDLKQMVVPYIEAGYRGSIDLSFVETVLHVTAFKEKNTFEEAVRVLHENRS